MEPSTELTLESLVTLSQDVEYTSWTGLSSPTTMANQRQQS